MKRKTLFFTAIAAVCLGSALAIIKHMPINRSDGVDIPLTKYGAYLAAQHAIYTNDFETAGNLVREFADVEYDGVKNTRMLVEFLDGKIPADVSTIADDKNAASKFIYDAYLVKNQKWDALYKRHKDDKSALYAPLKIWSCVATKHIKETLKYIDSLDSNASWKSFIRGQIYAEQGDITKAADEFAKVNSEFLNINDYMYLMSFYTAHDMAQRASVLRDEFTSMPGGMFMSDFEKFPDWAEYSGIANSLAFDIVQNVSHTQIMLYSDLSILMLRFAQIIGPETDFFQDTYNYYAGQFFANTHGNYAKLFDKISLSSPFYLFAAMRRAGDTESVDALKDILHHRPLFIPALNKLVAIYTAQGNKHDAVRVVERALKNEKISDSGRAYLLKRRALVYNLFGDLNRAQSDIHDAVELSGIDSEVLTVQARIWAAQGREIENAYDYAMIMVRHDPTDIVAWDTLATVISVREGNDAALGILERVGATANSCSSLFEHLGDAYIAAGKPDLARGAYSRAIELATDGFSVIPQIERKLRKIK